MIMCVLQSPIIPLVKAFAHQNLLSGVLKQFSNRSFTFLCPKLYKCRKNGKKWRLKLSPAIWATAGLALP